MGEPYSEPEDTYGNITELDGDSSSTYHYYGHPTVEILCSILTLIMFTAVFGNILVIMTILNNKRMRTRTNLLLCNLALSDILVGSVDVPFAIIALLNGDWIFSKALCNFNGYMVGLGVMLTIHTLMWISVHKYISIRNIFKQGLSLGQVFCMITAAWTWTLLYNTLTAIGWTSWEFKLGSTQCGPKIPTTMMPISHSVINKTFNFVIPVCVICYCYTKIFTDVRNHLKNLQDFSTVGMKTTLLKQKEISATLFTVVVVFLACYFPYIVYSASLITFGEQNVGKIYNPLAYLFMYLNSACNPLIYALKFPSFRKSFSAILCGSKDSSRHSSYFSPRSSFLSSFRKSLRRTKSLPNTPTKQNRRRPKRINTMPPRQRNKSPRLTCDFSKLDTQHETVPTTNDIFSDDTISDASSGDGFNDVFYEIQLEDNLESIGKLNHSRRTKKISISQPNLFYYEEMNMSGPSQEPSVLATLEVPWTDRTGSEGRIKDLDKLSHNTKDNIKSPKKIRKINALRPWTMVIPNYDSGDIERASSSSSFEVQRENRISRIFNGFKRSFNDLFTASFDEDDGINISESSCKKYSLEPPVGRDSQHLIGHN